MSLSIDKLSIKEEKVVKTPELEKLVKLIEKHKQVDAYSLLPKSVKHTVYFELNNCYVAFANAIRRTLVEDLTVYALQVDEKDVLSDDEFISGMSDVIMKNIGLVPIYQSGPVIDNSDQYDIYLYAFNNTNNIIDIKFSDLKVVKKQKKGSAEKEKEKVTVEDADDVDVEETVEDKESEVNIEELKRDAKKSNLLDLAPDSNIVLVRLRPGRYLKVRNIKVVSGTAVKDAGRFTMLNNIRYKPLDMVPFDQFADKGQHSYETDCKKFMLQFTTCGNASPKEIMENCCKHLNDQITDLKLKIKQYSESKAGSYFSGQDFSVSIQDNVYSYRFINHYISELYMLAQCCYVLDENTPFVSATVERYDSAVGLIKIKHADPNKLLMSACDRCLSDIKKVNDAF